MRLWFGCSHRKTSFPITRRREVQEGSRVANTYVVCLECGHEMPYLWNDMKIVKERRKASVSVEEQEQEREISVVV